MQLSAWFLDDRTLTCYNKQLVAKNDNMLSVTMFPDTLNKFLANTNNVGNEAQIPFLRARQIDLSCSSCTYLKIDVCYIIIVKSIIDVSIAQNYFVI